MKKILLLTFFISYSLLARENPFSPQKPTLVPKIITPFIKVEEKPLEIKEVKEIKTIPVKTTIVKKEKKPIPKPVIVSKPKKKKTHKKVTRSKLIYNGKFAKIKVKGSNIKIITHDNMLKHFILKSPTRLVIDLERFDVVQPFHKKVYGSKVKSLRVGHHDYFYRTTLKLRKNYRYKVKKQSYGYLIKLY